MTGANPAPAVVEREILTPAEVDALAEEMRGPFGAAVVLAAWCYLQPRELLSLERRDVDEKGCSMFAVQRQPSRGEAFLCL